MLRACYYGIQQYSTRIVVMKLKSLTLLQYEKYRGGGGTTL